MHAIGQGASTSCMHMRLHMHTMQWLIAEDACNTGVKTVRRALIA